MAEGSAVRFKPPALRVSRQRFLQPTIKEESMFKKSLSLLLVAVLVHTVGAAPALAGSNAEKEAQFAEKVKANILKLGTGPDALVKVKLRDKTKLEGYVSEAGTDSFVVMNT